MKRPLDTIGDRDNLILGGAAAVLVAVTVGGAWVSLHLAAVLTDTPPPTRDPLRLIVALVTGRVVWTGTATAVAAGLAVVLLILVLAVILLWPKGKGASKRMRPDLSARHMGRGRDVAHLTAAGSSRTATRLGTTGPGLPLGRAIAGKAMLHTSWEDMAILVAGPRTQKTTAYAIPAVLAAPGACLATSNKRDLVDATAAIRAQRGRVWVFDPQNIAGTAERRAQGAARWWWNPLTYVTSETRADRLAAQLVASARPPGAKTDAYFDSEAENLISLLLLAAACDSRPMTDVYSWLTRPRSEEAADILQEAGYGLQHQTLYALSHLPDKQMQGVYGTARALVKWLQNREVASWITPGAGEEFLPEMFACSSGTLYPLSREGTGSVGPLVAALTMAVLDALEESATVSPGGRLPVPFVGVLDEAANICRIRGLDAYYSHFGSRGIILLTILQSWAQGAEAWGALGMEKLWSSANARVYGGGVDDPAFLRRLSDLIGTTQQVHRTANVGGGKRTVTRAVQEQTILTPAELRELPQGRAVLFASGTPAILTHPMPWWDGPHADAIRGALAAA